MTENSVKHSNPGEKCKSAGAQSVSLSNCQVTQLSRVTSDQQIILFIFNIERFTVLTAEIFFKELSEKYFVFSFTG